MATKEEMQARARAEAERVGLDPDMFLRQINQESRWNHAAVSPKGARGLGQIMPDTARDPGYGVKPLQNDTWEENLRFSADYMGAMVKIKGNQIEATKAYNAGAGGNYNNPETRGYIANIAGPGAQGVTKADPLQAQRDLVARAASEAPLRGVAGSPSAAAVLEAGAAADAETADRIRKEAPGFGEAFGLGVAKNVFGTALGWANGGKLDPTFTPDTDRLLLAGLGNDKEEFDYVANALNSTDFEDRLERAKYNVSVKSRMSEAGWSSVAGVLAGGLTDPVGFAAGLGAGAAIRGTRVAGVMAATRSGRLALNIGDNAAGNVLAEVGVELMNQGTVTPHLLVEQAAYGAVFGGLGAPLAARRFAREVVDAQDFGKASAALETAVRAGVHESGLRGLTKTLDDVRMRMVERATREGEQDVAEVMAAMAPGTDVRAVLRDIRARRAAGELVDPDAQPRGTGMLEQRVAGEVGPVRLSDQAASIAAYAQRWDESVPAQAADMQQRLADWQELVRSHPAGEWLKSWLDTPGLVLQNSKSKVVRMLGAHLAESASGQGRREMSSALVYEMWHGKHSHEHIPALQALENEHLQTLGWSAVARNVSLNAAEPLKAAFWKQVAEERLAHRAALAAGREHVSAASPTIQAAAKQLDTLIRSMAELEKANGLEHGEGVLAGGYVGHMPYNWDRTRLLQALTGDPHGAGASIGRLLAEQFERKILKDTWAGMEEKAPELIKARQESLVQQITDVQGKIAELEGSRQDLTQVRDIERDASGFRKQVAEQAKLFKNQLKALEEELTDARAELAAAEARSQSAPAEDLIDVGEQSAPGIGERTLADLRNDPQLEEVTMADLVAMVDAQASKLDATERALWLGLKSSLRNTDVPVFLQHGATVERSQYVTGTRALVMKGLMDHRRLSPYQARVAMHELAHSVSADWLAKIYKELGVPGGSPAFGPIMELPDSTGFPAGIVRAFNRLEQVRGALMDHPEYGKQFGNPNTGVGYAMLNSHELLAQVFNEPKVRAALRAVEMPSGGSALRAVWEFVAATLGLGGKKRTGLDEVILALDEISQHTGQWRGRESSTHFSPSKRTPVEIVREIEHVMKLHDAELDKLKAARAVEKEAKSRAKEFRATDPAKKLAALELQLNRAKADLSDIQADPLGWFAEKIKSGKAAARTKAKALTSNYLSQIVKDPTSRTNSLPLHIARLGSDLLEENWAGKVLDEDMAKQFGELLQERLSDRSRTELDLLARDGDVRLLDFMETGGIAMAKGQLHRSIGQSALARQGLRGPEDIEAAIEAARMDGATEHELKQLRGVTDMLGYGTAQTDHPALHALRNYTYAIRMGKQGIAMLADIPQVMATLGAGKGMEFLSRAVREVTLTGEKAFNAEETEFLRLLSRDCAGLLGRDHRLMTLIADDANTGLPDMAGMGALQRFSAQAARFTSVVSGANMVDRALHRAALPMLATELIGAAKGKTSINDVRLADAGLYPERLTRVQAMLDRHAPDWKPGDSPRWDLWEDQEAADWLVGAIHRVTHQALQKGLMGEKPLWMTNSSIGRLLGQFRSFGFTAAEKLAARQMVGLQDSEAIIGATLGLAWAGILYTGRVLLTAGNREDRDQYVEDALSGTRLITGVMNMWNVSGLASDVVNMGDALMGGHMATQGPAAALGTINDLTKLPANALNLVTKGFDETSEDRRRVMKALPGGNSIPLMLLFGT